jgi:hypothetical protein
MPALHETMRKLCVLITAVVVRKPTSASWLAASAVPHVSAYYTSLVSWWACNAYSVWDLVGRCYLGLVGELLAEDVMPNNPRATTHQ